MGEMINDPNEYVKLGRWISCKPNLFFCCFFLLPADVKNSSYTWLRNTDARIFANIFANAIQKPQNANTSQ